MTEQELSALTIAIGVLKRESMFENAEILKSLRTRLSLEPRVLAERKEPVIDKSMVKRLMVQHGLANPAPDDALNKLTAEMHRLRGEIEKYQGVCAAAYQFVGAVDGPVRFLDALSNAANGEPASTEESLALLPVSAPDDAKDAARYRWLKDQKDEFDKMAGASCYGTKLSNRLWQEEDWDAAIDRARQSGEEGNG
ncbi:hypothetical protein AWB73_01997 [Caballeronia turbans]|nr:hypothetical protein AWB73_01997 [Caballeronia turbans]